MQSEGEIRVKNRERYEQRRLTVAANPAVDGNAELQGAPKRERSRDRQK